MNQIIRMFAEANDIKDRELARLDIIQRSFAPKATPDEFFLFASLAKKYDLDIINREIWLTIYEGKNGRKVSIFAGRDGFLSIAHKTGDFDGMETTIERIEEPFSKGEFSSGFQYVATTKVFSKRMSKPIIQTVWESEYSTGRDLWISKRRTMIQKVCESQALRKTFKISGLYDPAEMEFPEIHKEPIQEKVIEQPQKTETKIEKPVQQELPPAPNQMKSWQEVKLIMQSSPEIENHFKGKGIMVSDIIKVFHFNEYNVEKIKQNLNIK